MKLRPYASVEGVRFGGDEAAVTSVFGRAEKTTKNRRGWTELHYPTAIARFADGNLVELTADSRVVHIEDVVVQFSNLRRFLRENDPGTFERVGFIVSPRYGLAFDPGQSSWVTVFAKEGLSSWEGIGDDGMAVRLPEIPWKAPWRAIQFAAEIPGVERQLDLEITSAHPLYGKGATAVGRRIDNDDVLVRLNDGTYANVHLVWGRSGGGPFADKYPSWFLYGSLQSFVQAMQQDALEYGEEDET